MTAHGGRFPDLLVNEIGVYNGQVAVRTAGIIEVKADGHWTISVG